MTTHEHQTLRTSAYQAFADGQFENALKILSTCLERHGPDMQIFNDLAVVRLRLGHTEAALNYFRAAQALRAQQDGLLIDNLIDALDESLKTTSGSSAQTNSNSNNNSPAQPSPADDKFSRWLTDKASSLHADAQRLSSEQWATALYESVAGQPFENHVLPAFIDDETQRMFVGSSGVSALQEAHRFISVLLNQLEKNNLELTDNSVAVDFGSGWGRYTRFMLKYVHPDNLYGLEVSPDMVEHCRKAFGMANFLKVETMPPCQLRTGLVDLAFGYSVFSHLAPHCADAWISEFARIIKPGGLVMMTTQGRSFIDFCRNIRESGNLSHPWYISLSKAFTDSEQAYHDYDAGQFLHFGEGYYGGTYGESLIPKGYIERHWKTYFDLVDFIDDRAVLPQALFVLRRNGVPHTN